MRTPLRRALTLVTMLAAVSVPAMAQESEGDQGIASRYPRDVGIAAHPDVVFAEDFEATLPDVLARWDDIKSEGSLSLSGEAPAASSGTSSMLMHKKPGDGTTGVALYRRILPATGTGYERLHARMYVKFGANSDPIHHFGANIGGNNPPTRWPVVSAGNRPDGDTSFWTGIEPFGDVWRWDFYTIWMEMRSWHNDDGSGTSYYGNTFLRDTAEGNWEQIGPAVGRGEWVCVETMVRVNDLGQSNGEQAFWIDGQLVRVDGQIISHLGPGYPNGSWLRDKWSPDPAGKPFEGFRWRNDANLLVNYLWLYVYTEEDSHDIPVWYDDVVVATSYIGPLYSGSGSTGSSGSDDTGGSNTVGSSAQSGDGGASESTDRGDGCNRSAVGARHAPLFLACLLAAASLLVMYRRRNR